MKIAIIEDEAIVAHDLEVNIRELIDSHVEFVQLRSVSESIEYFRREDLPDLIFSDIQLGDGLSFEIFIDTPVSVPVIFCTAYDEYALDAFKVNGIDYILKPFTIGMLQAALHKYENLKKLFSTTQMPHYDALYKMIIDKQSKIPSSLLIHHKDKIIPVEIEDIAIFHLKHEVTHLITFRGVSYYPNKNLDELERKLGDRFFRANRQFLICRKAIIDVSSFFSRKLSVNINVPCDEKIIVSKGKAAQFLEWLSRH